MKYLRKLMESRPMLERIPDLVLLAEDPSCASERIQSTRGKNYAFIYSAYGRPIRVRMNEFNESKITASWYDPLTGKTSRIGEFKNTGLQSFKPPLPVHSPVPSQRVDWVLIPDSGKMN